MTDTGNVDWRNIPEGWTVTDTGPSFIAVNPDQTEYKLVTWDGQTARIAQRTLATMARKGTRL